MSIILLSSGSTNFIVSNPSNTYVLMESSYLATTGDSININAGAINLIIDGNIYTQSIGIGSLGVKNGSSITIGSQASISAQESGIDISDFSANITNYGEITGQEDFGIRVNSGVINNHGAITGEIAGVAFYSNAVLTNIGSIYSANLGVRVEGFDSTIINHGTIGAASIAISLTNSTNALVRNFGEISGADFAIVGSVEGERVVNSGVIHGDINLFEGNDILRSVNGVIEGEIYMGDGDDKAVGSHSDDTIYGNAGADILRGKGGEDMLVGGANADTINGGAGNDVLKGGAGADVINGGRDDDMLQGGGGADIFVFSRNAGHDTIIDYVDGIDKIDLSAFGRSEGKVLSAISNNGGNAFIDLELLKGHGVLMIVGAAGDLDASDFIL